MLRIALIYGLIAGLIVIGSITLGIIMSKGEGAMASEWLGYLLMIFALSLIFFGIKRHRDRNLGGVIKFLPALGVGLLISAVAGVAYLVGWETYLAFSGSEFIDGYTAAMIEKKQAAGLAGAELEAFIAKMEAAKLQYAQPLYRIPITFLEIFPVGIVISLISAAILRNPGVFPAQG